MKLQKAAGIAALYSAACFVFVFAVMAILIAPAQLGPAATHATERIAFMSTHQNISMAIYLVGHILFGVAMTVLSLGLH